jgi:hypothetical protein
VGKCSISDIQNNLEILKELLADSSNSARGEILKLKQVLTRYTVDTRLSAKGKSTSMEDYYNNTAVYVNKNMAMKEHINVAAGDVTLGYHHLSNVRNPIEISYQSNKIKEAEKVRAGELHSDIYATLILNSDVITDFLDKLHLLASDSYTSKARAKARSYIQVEGENPAVLEVISAATELSLHLGYLEGYIGSTGKSDATTKLTNKIKAIRESIHNNYAKDKISYLDIRSAGYTAKNLGALFDLYLDYTKEAKVDKFNYTLPIEDRVSLLEKEMMEHYSKGITTAEGNGYRDDLVLLLSTDGLGITHTLRDEINENAVDHWSNDFPTLLVKVREKMLEKVNNLSGSSDAIALKEDLLSKAAETAKNKEKYREDFKNAKEEGKKLAEGLLNPDKNSKEYQEAIKVFKDEIPSTVRNTYRYTSGAAEGADAIWDKIVRILSPDSSMVHFIVGDKEATSSSSSRDFTEAHYLKNGLNATVEGSKAFFKGSSEEIDDSTNTLLKLLSAVNSILNTTYKPDATGFLQARNSLQVVNADMVVAAAPLDGDRAVLGGTNTAVQLAIKLGKPVLVLNTGHNPANPNVGWYSLVGDKFTHITVTEAMAIARKNENKKLALIGTRELENRKNGKLKDLIDNTKQTDQLAKNFGAVGHMINFVKHHTGKTQVEVKVAGVVVGIVTPSNTENYMVPDQKYRGIIPIERRAFSTSKTAAIETEKKIKAEWDKYSTPFILDLHGTVPRRYKATKKDKDTEVVTPFIKLGNTEVKNVEDAVPLSEFVLAVKDGSLKENSKKLIDAIKRGNAISNHDLGGSYKTIIDFAVEEHKTSKTVEHNEITRCK